MARIYYPSHLISDIELPMLPNISLAANVITLTASGSGGTRTISIYTEKLHPGIYPGLAKETITIKLDVVTSPIIATDQSITVLVHKTSSTGSIVTSADNLQVELSTVGQKTFTYTFNSMFDPVDLGSFKFDERLRVDIIVTNAIGLMGPRTTQIAVNDVDTCVITPFNVRTFSSV